MNVRTLHRAMVLAFAATATVAAVASSPPATHTDAEGDAVLRRTDPGRDALVPPAPHPDLLDVRLAGWLPFDAVTDPYAGVVIDGEDADLFRLDVRIAGRRNPPGPLGAGALPFDPLRFGDAPVHGFIEFDIDNDERTGGECSGAALRYTANAARFASLPGPPHDEHCATDGAEVDANFNTSPRIERTGAEFTLALCGCHAVTIVSESLNADGVFESGESWIVRSRFFQRAGGFEAASAAFGGSFFGLYDPITDLRFSHDAIEDVTTISLVFPLTMDGAALLRGGPSQSLDLDVSNDVSIHEAIDDIIIGAAFPPFGCPGELVEEWDGDNPEDFLDPTDWDVIAIIGVPCLSPESSLYAWTDVGFNDRPGDFNADGVVDSLDADQFDAALGTLDGGPLDADGVSDGAYTLANPGPDFSLFDVNNDGRVDAEDRPDVVVSIPGDANGDCAVNFTDLNLVLENWGAATPPEAPPLLGDVNDDGAVNFTDLNLVLENWGAACP